MPWPAIAKRRSRPGATSTKPSQSSSPDCSQRSRHCSAGRPRWPETIMADPPRDSPGVATARRAFYVLGTIALVVASLSWGRYVFVTFAVAVLLTLLLGPVVSYLERRGLKRTPAVLSTALLAFLLISLLAWAVTI